MNDIIFSARELTNNNATPGEEARIGSGGRVRHRRRTGALTVGPQAQRWRSAHSGCPVRAGSLYYLSLTDVTCAHIHTHMCIQLTWPLLFALSASLSLLSVVSSHLAWRWEINKWIHCFFVITIVLKNKAYKRIYRAAVNLTLANLASPNGLGPSFPSPVSSTSLFFCTCGWVNEMKRSQICWSLFYWGGALAYSSYWHNS